ncbi:MAG: M20/M25/M40 family metallo-hydrolase [Gemmatimonadetes bacterium]|nr:M20/M25/M40 family metallo-hydrolase [Gemmatimonadota bacterium]
MRAPGPALVALSVALTAVGCSSPGGDGGRNPEVLEAAASITASDIQAHITFLASDALGGRATPSPGLDSAVLYVGRHFAGVGLRPGVGDSSFAQRYPLPLVRVRPDAPALRLRGRGGAVTGRYGRDFAVVPGREEQVRARVLPFVGVPPERSMDTIRVFAGRLPGAVATAPWVQAREQRVREALRRGASAVIHVLDDPAASGLFADVSAAVAEPARLLGGLSAVAEVFLAASVLEAALGVEVPGAALDSALAAVPVELELSVPAEHLDRAEGVNAVAICPGADPILGLTYVVMSAHIDHLGVGEPVAGDSIYNGADDDGSGVAALLEVAGAFAALEPRTRRSVIFLAVSGEERGLLGSRWFLDHAPVPVDSIVADVNLDMLGRNSPDSIAAIGIEYSSLGRMLKDVARRAPDLGLVVTGDLWPDERFFFRSDHFQFVVRGIPAIFLFAGTHEDYHRPSDEAGRIDMEKVARVARLAFYTAVRIANSDDAPTWTQEGRNVLRVPGR